MKAVAVFVNGGTRFYLYSSEDGRGWVMYQPADASEPKYLPGSEGPWQEVFEQFVRAAGYRPVRVLEA